MRRYNLQSLFGKRKTLFFALCIMIISVLSLTVVYAALSVTLNISGATEVTASNWDIYLDNVIVRTGSVSANAPSISGNNLSFTAKLTTPGDYYEFSVDVVNDGTIDAMIDSIVKTPELTEEQAKYIKYEATYQNGESISTKQTLKKGTRTPIIIRVEFRKDLTAADLPKTTTSLNLKLTLVYVQSDGTGSEVSNNGVATNLAKPTCKLSVSGSRPYSEWYITQPTISILTTPGYSEITDVHIQNSQALDKYALDFDNISSKTQTTDTSGTIWYGYAKDEMGNVVECQTPIIKVDTVAPSSPTGGSISVSGSSTAAMLETVSGSSDGTGSGNIQYRYIVLKNNSTTPDKNSGVFSNSYSFTRACGTTYYAYAIAVDDAGNKSNVYKIGTASDPASSYGAWSTCTAKCGGGIQTRTNTCPLVTTNLSQSCGTVSCCSSVSTGSWVDTSTCSKSCGGGTKTQTRQLTSSYDGSSCGTDVQTISCNTFSCCSNVTYQSGSICSCTTGTYNRIAYSTYDNSRCPSSDQTSGGPSCNNTQYNYSNFGTGTTGCKNFAAQYLGGSSNYTNGNMSLCTGSSVSSCVTANTSTCNTLGTQYIYLRSCKMY